jgi:hypothetical protein
MRCCIGFVGQQCGIRDDHLFRKDTAAAVDKEFGAASWPIWFGCSEFGILPTDVLMAYTINDDRNIDDSVREKRLKEIFARNGDEIVFVD